MQIHIDDFLIRDEHSTLFYVNKHPCLDNISEYIGTRMHVYKCVQPFTANTYSTDNTFTIVDVSNDDIDKLVKLYTVDSLLLSRCT